jgi:hypothetical protein
LTVPALVPGAAGTAIANGIEIYFVVRNKDAHCVEGAPLCRDMNIKAAAAATPKVKGNDIET